MNAGPARRERRGSNSTLLSGFLLFPGFPPLTGVAHAIALLPDLGWNLSDDEALSTCESFPPPKGKQALRQILVYKGSQQYYAQ